MDSITMLLADMPKGFWQSVLGWFIDFVGTYGLAIVVFTILLKLLLSPLDFWQKNSMRKTQKAQAILKPELAKIKEKYGYNKQLENEKTMELYKKNKINPASGCLPMLVYLVTTMVVFFTLFGAMNSISNYKIVSEYETLQTTYVQNYVNFKNDFITNSATKVVFDGNEYNYAELITLAGNEFDLNAVLNSDNKYEITVDEKTVIFDSKEQFVNQFVESVLLPYKTIAQDKVLEKFTEIKEGFLWIKNIYRPDNYSSSFLSFDEFINTNRAYFNPKTNNDLGIKYYYYSEIENKYFEVGTDATINAETLNQAKAQARLDYNNVTASVHKGYSSWNGYFILILLAGITTVLGQLLGNIGAKAKGKKGEEVKINQPTNKIMLIVMPAIMIWFTWGYNSLFALYVVVNSAMSILINYVINLIVNKIDANRENKVVVGVSLSDHKSSKPSFNGSNSNGKNKQIVKTEIANQDYKIQKKGKITYEKEDTQKSKDKGEE